MIEALRHKSRLALHNALKRPAIHVRGSVNTPCFARTKRVTTAHGDMTGSDFGAAERMVEVPEIIVWLTEIDLKRRDVFSFGVNEAWRVETVQPADGQTQTAQVSRISETEAATYAVPGA